MPEEAGARSPSSGITHPSFLAVLDRISIAGAARVRVAAATTFNRQEIP